MSLGMKWRSPNMLVGYHLSDTADYGPSGLTLTNTGSVTFPADGFGTGCANFAGTSNYLDSAGIVVDSSWTYSLWVKFTTVADLADYSIIYVAKLTGTYEFTKIQLNRAGAVYTIEVYGSDATTTLTYAIPNFALSKWYHLVLTRNSTGSAMILYWNGAKVATGAGSTDNAASTTFRIAFVTGMLKLLGRIDEVACYNTILSEGDVRRLYAEARGMLV